MLSSLTITELILVKDNLNAMVGGQWDRFVLEKEKFGFGFWTGSKLNWYFGSMSSTRPFILPVAHLPQKFIPSKLPLALFFKSHFKSSVLAKVELNQQEGRVLKLFFECQNNSVGKVELRFFPHGQNIILSILNKQVSLKKIKPIKNLNSEIQLPEPRSLDVLCQQLIDDPGPQKTQPQKTEEKLFEKEVSKREHALLKIEKDILLKESMLYRDTAEWIKNNHSLSVPAELEKWVDKTLSIHENIQICFDKSKKNEAKIVRSKKRLLELKESLEQLKSTGHKSNLKPPNTSSLLREAGATGKTLKLDDSLCFYVGKSAKDNLSILRRAQAWDLWLHIKDEPGSHGVLRRNRNQKVNEKQYNEIFDFLLRHSLGKSYSTRIGTRVQVIVAECRYVRPIKGDRLGRVTVSKEEIHSFVLK